MHFAVVSVKCGAFWSYTSIDPLWLMEMSRKEGIDLEDKSNS